MTQSLKFLNPEEILKKMNIEKHMLAADFGCGAGGWAIPLAKRLARGRVYAFDVQEEMLSALRSRSRLLKAFNIEPILCDLEDPKGVNLADKTMDLVLITNLLFQVKEKKRILKEAKRVLKKGGQLLIVDWYENSSFGPKGKRVSPQEVKELAKSVGFELKEELEAGDYHYALIFTKP